ncbi:dTDP-4-dehydrorhamnose reductase [Desulfoluna spongiiphila]|uniref:dTDP-4-dehydrorhamnose reductase n=1 Tax=Desulfoluna spongiiphila TaxID=419481 RepID=A0A1G5JTT3_9BACT|nr:dTDP-4-dehydrorhamnose reductase [Desulfoluna spongiiphila]SCY91158.1 dTDP-4-dehydrorhamnose reductase [Desulfoluna spongiiphila]
MKLLLLGSGGQLGQDLIASAGRYGIGVEAVGHAQCDIGSKDQLCAVFDSVSVDGVINAAAYTKVDQAETDTEAASRVNRDGAGLVAEQCSAKGLPLLHVSTDYVFDGEGSNPYAHDGIVCPRSVYGRTKAEGEQLVLGGHSGAAVIRTSWLFGEHGPNFLKTMVRLAFEREIIQVVSDQLGCPTWSAHLADALLSMMQKTVAGEASAQGIYHYCGAPQASWHEFALDIIGEVRRLSHPKVREVVPISTEEYPTPAERPRYSVLDCSRIEDEFGIQQGDWRLGVKTVVAQELRKRN